MRVTPDTALFMSVMSLSSQSTLIGEKGEKKKKNTGVSLFFVLFFVLDLNFDSSQAEA